MTISARTMRLFREGWAVAGQVERRERVGPDSSLKPRAWGVGYRQRRWPRTDYWH